jgi:hypothetical protein
MSRTLVLVLLVTFAPLNVFSQETDVLTPFQLSNNSAKELDRLPIDPELVRKVLRLERLGEVRQGLLAQEVSQRIAKTQSNFVAEDRDGATEVDVTRALNRLTRKLDLPGYAMTTVSEVREVRAKLLQLTPDLMKVPHPERSRPSPANPVTYRLTPIQAVFLAITVFEQKMSNPDHQLTATEWKVDRDLKRRNNQARKGAQETVHSLKLGTETPRQREINAKLEAAFDSLTEEDLSFAAHTLLDDLGVDR